VSAYFENIVLQTDSFEQQSDFGSQSITHFRSFRHIRVQNFDFELVGFFFILHLFTVLE